MALILVVDDEAPLRDLLAQVLQDAGYRVVVASHGRQGLDLALQERPDLVISDIMMPVMSGVDLCRRIKSDLVLPPIPVILASSAGAPAADGAGADAFIAKPFELDAVEALVKRWLPV